MKDPTIWMPCSAKEFGTVVTEGQPLILSGIARDWPLVDAALRGPEHWLEMLEARSTEALIEVLRAEPENHGRFHYTEDGLRLNFVRGKTDLRTFLKALKEQASAEQPFAIAAMGILADQAVSGFSQSHRMPFAPATAVPRLWIGNRTKVATHSDPTHNIAVVAAGRRRFTLFPPEEEANLYMGPSHFTPAGTPISMVHVTAPDFNRYPRYKLALQAAQNADLGPGDAVFIPSGWYHHVEALEPFNMLVNYWWDPEPKH